MSNLRKSDESFDRRKGAEEYWFYGRPVPRDAMLIYCGIHELNQVEQAPLRYKDIERWLMKEIQLAFGKNKLTTAVDRLVKLGLVKKEPREHGRMRVSDLENVPPALDKLVPPHLQMEDA